MVLMIDQHCMETSGSYLSYLILKGDRASGEIQRRFLAHLWGGGHPPLDSVKELLTLRPILVASLGWLVGRGDAKTTPLYNHLLSRNLISSRISLSFSLLRSCPPLTGGTHFIAIGP